MASRLNRWIAITGFTLVALMAALLPPGEAREPGFGALPDRPTDAIDGALLATRAAIRTTEQQLAGLRRARLLARFRADTGSPLVLRAFLDSFAVDTARTRAARTLWQTLPPGSRVPRTLLIGSGDMERILPLTADRCEARIPNLHARSVYAGAGGCYLQAWFGLPGAGLRTWIDSMGGLDVPRPRVADRGEIREVRLSNDLWAMLALGDPESFAWWGSPELEACAGGRSSFCAAALRFASTGEADPRAWVSGWARERLFGDVPAALLRDLGPARFATLWRSARPLPETYQAITGRSFDEWAERYVQRRVGRVVRHTALDLGGWLGWGLWMGLLGAVMATRLRAQGVTA